MDAPRNLGEHGHTKHFSVCGFARDQPQVRVFWAALL